MKVPTPIVVAEALSKTLNLYDFRCKLAISILTKKTRKCNTIAEHINLAFKVFKNAPFRYIGWPLNPNQIPAEIEALLTTLAERKVHTMLEIGTQAGGSLYLFTQVLAPNAIIVSLDLFGGPQGSGYPPYKKMFYSNFGREKRIFLIQADSHKKTSLETVKSILKGQKLDFLFIDGDHTYEGVKMDFQMYSPLVRKGGLIAFHDICCEGPPKTIAEVNKFWREIKCAYTHQEIINSPYQKAFGIGLLCT